ncbi:uncharacterized protein J3D65DRAFT_647569 [Phyllosticta citribraziliensis]|uniref:GRF zinc finger domain containing protein n=1 Tax=Phyllosticta citribraziliensis TaxID=989973 RepID=A0ABR1LDP4_9PEZI
MDAFVSRKRRKISPDKDLPNDSPRLSAPEEESTDFKLAILASLHPGLDQGLLLEALLSADGCVERASENLGQDGGSQNLSADPLRKRPAVVGYQSSLSSFGLNHTRDASPTTRGPKRLTKKGKTLHLYSPEDIETHTPCSIIHNFLPAAEADALLREILSEAPSYGRDQFKLFDRVVESPHTFCFYVDAFDDVERQRNDYVYNGANIADVRRTLPCMRAVAAKVQRAVNDEIARRIVRFQDGKRLRYQSPAEWLPNASFVNCYDGGAESVGFHSDQLTYLGPRAVIGSLSLGVAREFRVRRVVPRDDDDDAAASGGGGGGSGASKSDADAEGQIATHLPHNSLLVMHANMQEEWKHSIAPAQAIDPHPVAGNKRINITYRHYRDSLHPKYTPRCRCNVPTVLRCVQKKRENRGKYMWMCHASFTPGQQGCSFFQWAEFDENGEPPWAKKMQLKMPSSEK